MSQQIPATEASILEALLLQATAAWQALEMLGKQGTRSGHPVTNALLGSLCVSPLRDPRNDMDSSLAALADLAPRSACAVALSRALLALAQEKLLIAPHESLTPLLRQALASSLKAVTSTGMPMPAHLPEQILNLADHLEHRLASQLDLALAKQLDQLPTKLVLVLGMHRSGTSALSGLLVQAGLDGPVDLMPPSPSNPMGYWESLAAVQLNDQLLQQLGSHWSRSWALPEQRWEMNEQAVRQWRSGLLHLLQTTYPACGRPVLKDPRLCVLLPGLRPWLESGLITCVAFLPIRHPAEVVASLAIAEGTPHRQSLLLWLGHVLQAERNSRPLQRLIIDYKQLLADPHAVLKRCGQTLVQAGGEDTLELDAASFIDPQLQHQRVSTDAPNWVLDEETEFFYELACRVYTVIVDTQLSEPERTARLDQRWHQWTTMVP